MPPSAEQGQALELGHRFGRWLVVEPEERSLEVLKEACLLDQIGESEEAMACLSEALEDKGPRASLLEARGALYLAAGFPRAAVGDFQQALRLAPERANAWYALGHACQLLGLSRQALEALDRAQAQGSHEAGMFLARARVLRTLERTGAAARDYSAALNEGAEPCLEILVETVTLASSDPVRFPVIAAQRERLEACQGVTLSDDAWLLRALLKELGGESEEEVCTAFRALDCAPAELAQLAGSLLLAIQLVDPETSASARGGFLAAEPDSERRARLERCLSVP